MSRNTASIEHRPEARSPCIGSLNLSSLLELSLDEFRIRKLAMAIMGQLGSDRGCRDQPCYRRGHDHRYLVRHSNGRSMPTQMGIKSGTILFPKPAIEQGQCGGTVDEPAGNPHQQARQLLIRRRIEPDS
jgi:hypothetical protein